MKKDFLRHIVNTKISYYSRIRRPILGVLDEARKLIASAENKYNFSVYGGDPVNLAKYIMSSDFDLVVSLLKSANALDVLVDILKTTRDTYSDIPEVVEAIEERLSSLEREVTRVSEKQVVREAIEEKIAGLKTSVVGDRVVVEDKGFRAEVIVDRDKYVVKINTSIEKRFNSRSEAVSYIERVYKSIKQEG